jgi:hypothetical protein
MFGVAPPLTCTRIGCDADATWHVIWTADGENGMCCDKHETEARRRWVFYAIHPYRLECSADDARVYWLIDGSSICLHPDDPARRAAEAVEVTA